MRFLFGLIVLLGVLVNAGCQQQPVNSGEPLELSPSPTAPQTTETPNPVISTPGRTVVPMTDESVQPPSSEPRSPVTEGVPSELLTSILNDLADRSGAAPEKISVIRAEAVVWNDGSLGCHQPGMEYAQMLVNGYWIVLEAEGEQYDYRATSPAYYFLCEGGTPPASRIVNPDV